MLVFFKKVIFFSLPILLLFTVPVFVVVEGREYVSTKDVVDTQSKYPESIFGFAYNDISFYSYKESLVATKNPKVIALGTSRVMQFREEFFTKDTLFVNAGGAGKSLADIERFVTNLPSTTTVQVIIIGLDKEILVAKPSPSKEIKESILPVRFTRIIVTMSRRVYLDYISHKNSFTDLMQASKQTSAIGLSALLHGNGFRSDGSYRYGSAVADQGRLPYVEAQVNQSVLDVTNKNNSLVEEETQNLKNNLTSISRILTLGREKRIIIIGIMPPYPTSIYKAMIGKDGTLEEISTKLSQIFKDEKSIFFDLSSLDTFGGLDTEFVDGIHGTDVMYLKMISYIVSNTNVLHEYTNSLLLNQLLKKSKDDFLSF